MKIILMNKKIKNIYTTRLQSDNRGTTVTFVNAATCLVAISIFFQIFIPFMSLYSCTSWSLQLGTAEYTRLTINDNMIVIH